jgi:hypothetical protein
LLQTLTHLPHGSKRLFGQLTIELGLGFLGFLDEIQLLLHGSEHGLQRLGRSRTNASLLKLLDHVPPGFHRIIHTGHVIRLCARLFVVLPAELSVESAVGFGL